MIWNLIRTIQLKKYAPLLWGFVVAFVIGCSDSTVKSPVVQQPDSGAAIRDSPTESSSSVDAPAQPANAPPNELQRVVVSDREVIREAWDLVLVQGAKVGYAHFQEFGTIRDGKPVRELVSNNEISMQRFGQSVTQRIEATSIETAAGEVLGFTTKMHTGQSELLIEGKRFGETFRVNTTTLGKTQASSINWKPTWLGFFADQQSLRQKTMQPGEQRKLTALVPGMAQVGEMTLSAKKLETTKLLGESRELLRIDSLLIVAGTKIQSVVWADAAGEVLKMSIPGLQHETYRTTKEVALAPIQKLEFDVGEQTVVKVRTAIPNAHDSTRVVYTARLTNGSPMETFAHGPSQFVKAIDDQSAQITVHAIRPGEIAKAAETNRPTDSDLEPNSLIQSDDGAIVSLAERFAEGQTDPWTLAKTFEARVKDYVHSKNFSQAISSAADVVRSREGDCTEHAVLLAALCRAKKIPARVAIGLVYYTPVQGFAYHMWNEVWIDDGWVPIDATLGKGGIGAAHLKIATSDLATASPIAALLPVVEVIGQLELEVVSVE